MAVPQLRRTFVRRWLCVFLSCAGPFAAAQAAKPAAFNAPATDIDAPASAAGLPLPDPAKGLVLNVYPKGEQATEPQVVADVGGERGQELRLGADGTLVATLRGLKAKHGAGFRVLLNAQPDLRYASVQLVMTDCAAAGVTEMGLVTKPLDKPDARTFLPCSLPIKAKGKGEISRDKIPPVPPPQVEIFISSANGNGPFLARLGKETIADGPALSAAIEAKVKELAAGGAKADQVQVLLSPRFRTTHGEIVAVLDAVQSAKCPNVGFTAAKD